MRTSNGWFEINRVQPGQRTIAEQMLGLAPALEIVKGARVLDLGSAEGCISLEFAKAGAAAVLALEGVEGHVAIAREHCAHPAIRFEVADLNVVAMPESPEYDIVLALAVLHKLTDPEAGIRYAARNARRHVAIRLPIGSRGGIRGKFSKREADINTVMPEEGFRLLCMLAGPRGELVQHWTRAG